MIEHQALDQRGLVAFGGKQLDGHACGGAAIHGVENVGAQAHGNLLTGSLPLPLVVSNTRLTQNGFAGCLRRQAVVAFLFA
jgi:hypothetical protein